MDSVRRAAIPATPSTPAQHDRHARMLQVATAGGPMTSQQQKLLSVVMDICAGATRRWLAGTYTAAEARSQIETSCELLELPDEVVDAELDRAAPEIAIQRAG